MEHYDAIVLGAGPAGLSAGIYLARAKQNVVILDQGTVGGQVLLTHAVANYPGLPELSGYQLASTMKTQAEGFGCTLVSNTNLTDITLKDTVKRVRTEDKEYAAPVIILAMGGRPRNLGIESEDRLKGLGISYCATCDGDFFTGQKIMVVGGGNSALEEAVSLTRYADKVTIVHQFDHFQGYAHAIEAARANPKIDFILESTVHEFLGNESLEGAVIEHTLSGEKRRLDITGAFILIGYLPNTAMIAGQLSLNERGEIITDEGMKTSLAGVFAAGDARQKRFRQITTAVGDGTVAALSAMEYLEAGKRAS
ncbi:NAD(P)/FAD-dependent oxidoreductase [Sediminispirochaeta bajacaliforniensis]|uniref:NAD(P)/FAD-dependent oxidoreductase n=1 Tax=Sediminispirochaeta bajacaliforniensis TaxID=148 RepID=UPI0003618010|nr:FAD-dependent oxidoreductase [Sediminispirochaeta bajacaliforniensis]